MIKVNESNITTSYGFTIAHIGNKYLVIDSDSFEEDSDIAKGDYDLLYTAKSIEDAKKWCKNHAHYGYYYDRKG